jgi:peptide/nickel transport system permease protein
VRRLRLRLIRWQIVLALLIIVVYVGIAIAAPLLAPQETPDKLTAYRILKRGPIGSRVPMPPGPGIPLGTVPGGIDVYYALIWGTAPALRFGLLVALSAALIGTLIGAVSGYLGGQYNRLIMRFADAFLAFPAIAGVFLFLQVLTPPSADTPPTTFQEIMTSLNLSPVMLALILFSWMPYARMINANVILLKKSEYVLAATTLGASHSRIVFRHLLPNSVSPSVVMAARDVGAMVILEASFTFIGLSGELPWGVLLVSGRNWIIGPGGNPLAYWWVFLPVTLALVLFGIGWNLLGDSLNVFMNPRLRR